MDIYTQIKTIIFSFIYGMFFFFFLGLNYKFLIGNKKFLKILLTFLFTCVNVLLYFIILKKINYGVFHIYEVLAIVIGFWFCNLISFFIERKRKK